MTLSRKWWEPSAEHSSGDEEPRSYTRRHLDIGDLMILSTQGSAWISRGTYHRGIPRMNFPVVQTLAGCSV